MPTHRQQLDYVKRLRAFGEETLSLEFDGSFRRVVSRYRTANWLYVVRADRLASALSGTEIFRFSWDLGRARRWERYHRGRGRHTYLYSAEAHGGRRCPITPSLLAASRARQGYVILHEAWHSTLRLEGIRMPYALEEATGRVVGVLGAVLFAERYGDPELISETGAQERAWGAFARFVNRVHAQLTAFYKQSPTAAQRRTMFSHIRRDARLLSGKMSTGWEREELTRTMNNALFFRYHDYTRHYPLALRVHKACRSLQQAMRTYRRAGQSGAIAQLQDFLRSR